MRLRSAIIQKLQDLRLRDKFLAEGRITKEQVDEFIKNLPDDSDKGEQIKTDNFQTSNKKMVAKESTE